MPTTIQGIELWRLHGVIECINSEMSDAEFRKFARHNLAVPQAGTTAAETAIAGNGAAPAIAIRNQEAPTRNTKARAPAPNTRTATRRGSRREQLLNLISDSDGLARGDILEFLHLKGNKSGEMSVSNALTALIKRNQIRREGGRYLPIAEVQQGEYRPTDNPATQAAAA